MGQFGTLRAAIVAGVALAVSAVAAYAGEADVARKYIDCAPTRADTTTVSLDDVHFGFFETFAWASAKVRVQKRDGSVSEYALRGRADPIQKELTPNQESPGFAYPGFSCTIRSTAIVAVQNCRSANQQRTCEVGLRIYGTPAAYAVSLTAERLPQ